MAKEIQEVETIETVVEENRWTFKKYGEGIKRFKWWVLGFTVCGAIVGFLGFEFILNPLRKQLVASYDYSLAGEKEENSDNIRLIDGSIFDPSDITSREYLQKVKDSNEAYAKVDIDKIIRSGAIKVTKITESDAATSTSTSYFKLTAKASVFPNDTLGQSFLYDLVNSPIQVSTVAIKNFSVTSYLTDNFAELTFDRQITQLDKQFTAIDELYASLAEDFGASAIADVNNKRVFDIHNAFDNKYVAVGDQKFTKELKALSDSNQYVNYEEGHEAEKIAEIKSLAASYISSIDSNKKTINSLKETRAAMGNIQIIVDGEKKVDLPKSVLDLNVRIEELEEENANLDKLLVKYGYEWDGTEYKPSGKTNTTLYRLEHLEDEWVKGCKDFKAKLLDYKTKLLPDIDVSTSVYQFCYSKYQNKVNIKDSGYVMVEGAISSFIGIPAGMVLFFLVTTLVTEAIVVYKKDEEK